MRSPSCASQSAVKVIRPEFKRCPDGWFQSNDIGIEILDTDIDWIYANSIDYVIIEKENADSVVMTVKHEHVNIREMIVADSKRGWIALGHNKFYIKIEDKKTLVEYSLRYNLTKVSEIEYDEIFYTGDYELVYHKYVHD